MMLFREVCKNLKTLLKCSTKNLGFHPKGNILCALTLRWATLRVAKGLAFFTSEFLVFLPNGKIFYLSLFPCLIFTALVFANDMQKEINHLLIFVEQTNCQYERNGKMHSGKEAGEHIKNKYTYFKNDIDSAEKFIELSATKSTMSGKYYLVHCPGHPVITSQEWLLEELKTFRTGGVD